ncbi:MAG: hotdog fold thioesterase [Bacteroidota bacterium]
MIWKHKPQLELLNSTNIQSLVTHIGIKFTNWGDDYLQAEMPVDHRTIQPYSRILHGGASVVLAETIGSVASTFCIADLAAEVPVGIEINASHLRSVKSGKVIATVKPIRVGRKIHVWNIDITDEAGKMVCNSRLTMAIIPKKGE